MKWEMRPQIEFEDGRVYNEFGDRICNDIGILFYPGRKSYGGSKF